MFDREAVQDEVIAGCIMFKRSCHFNRYPSRLFVTKDLHRLTAQKWLALVEKYNNRYRMQLFWKLII